MGRCFLAKKGNFLKIVSFLKNVFLSLFILKAIAHRAMKYLTGDI